MRARCDGNVGNEDMPCALVPNKYNMDFSDSSQEVLQKNDQPEDSFVNESQSLKLNESLSTSCNKLSINLSPIYIKPEQNELVCAQLPSTIAIPDSPVYEPTRSFLMPRRKSHEADNLLEEVRNLRVQNCILKS